MIFKNLRSACVAAVTTTLLFASLAMSLAAQAEGSARERELLGVLQSNAAKSEKAIACKHLAIHGSAAAVPELATLLADKELSSWARIALEAIPGPAADAALRDALPKLNGLLLIGVINSIGVRHDAKAASALEPKLKDADPQVASAAAIALGKIGTPSAAKALTRALNDSRVPAMAEGCVRCAETMLKAGDRKGAMKLYDAVRKAPASRQRALEATRGAILARGDDGIPLLLEQLRSPDPRTAAMALRTARELPGPKATTAIAAELRRAAPDRQPLLLLALADRGDASALPSVVEATKTGSPELRLVAVSVLEKLGGVSSVPVLVEAAADANPKLSEPAVAALVRLPGDGVDADVLTRLQQSSGKQREILIRVAAQRGLAAALPAVEKSVQDANPGIRSAATQAIGTLGSERDLPALVRFLAAAKDKRDRDDLEAALLNISSRVGAKAVPHLQPLMQSTDPAGRALGLRALASAGGPDALASVKAAIQDQNEELQDEAVRTLSAWPNTWPEDSSVAAPLLELAREGKKKSHQILALRGYLQYVQGDRNLKPADKLQKVEAVVPLIQRPEEKRLAISVIDEVSSPGTLALLKSFATDAAVKEDACGAMMKLTGRMAQGLSPEQRREALRFVVDTSTNENLKKRAQERLNSN